jgi:hypothetical protein
MDSDDLRTWLLDEVGRIIEQQIAEGYPSLAARDRLIYCLWVADYGMCNAGDLATAADLHPTFRQDARSAALELGLPKTTVAFLLKSRKLQRRYFDLFNGVAAEIRAA